jgi:hypothetical protein
MVYFMQVGYSLHGTCSGTMRRGQDKPTHTQKHRVFGTLQDRICVQHLPCYPDEFTFRIDRRTSRARGMLFYRLVQQAVQVDHVTTKEMFKNMGRGPARRI